MEMVEVAGAPVRLLLGVTGGRLVDLAQRVGDHRLAKRGRAPPAVRGLREDNAVRPVTLHQAPVIAVTHCAPRRAPSPDSAAPGAALGKTSLPIVCAGTCRQAPAGRESRQVTGPG